MGKLDQLKQGAAASLAGYQEPEGAAAQPQQMDIEGTIADRRTAAPKPALTTKAPPPPPRVKPKAWTRGEGKSRNPEYGRFTVYVPDKLRTTAERKWEDSTGRDASDLIEHLLKQYVGI